MAAPAPAFELGDIAGITDGSIDSVFPVSDFHIRPGKKGGQFIGRTSEDRILSGRGSQQEICAPDLGFGAF